MDEQPLSLSHREYIQQKVELLGECLSDYSFVSLFLYRKKRDTVLVNGTFSYLKGLSRDGKRILIPLDPMDLAFDFYTELLLKGECEYLYPVSSKILSYFLEGPFSLQEKVEWNDYVYQTKKIATYSGRHLDGRRNLVKQFKENVPHKSFSYNEGYKEGVIDLLKKTKVGDCEAALEAFDLYEPLGLEGVVILSEGKVIAFAIGSKLNEKMFDVHFGKADLSYKGLYQVVYQTLALKVQERFEWMNFECDLGLSNLRESKKQYNPDHRERVWQIGVRR